MVLGGDQAGAEEVEERRQVVLGEAVDLGREAPRMWSWPNHLRTTLAFLPSTNALVLECRVRDFVKRSMRSLSSSSGDAVVDVLAAVVGVEAEDREREGQQQTFVQRQQEALQDVDAQYFLSLMYDYGDGAYSGERDHRFWFKVITFTRIRNLISSQ